MAASCRCGKGGHSGHTYVASRKPGVTPGSPFRPLLPDVAQTPGPVRAGDASGAMPPPLIPASCCFSFISQICAVSGPFIMGYVESRHRSPEQLGAGFPDCPVSAHSWLCVFRGARAVQMLAVAVFISCLFTQTHTLPGIISGAPPKVTNALYPRFRLQSIQAAVPEIPQTGVLVNNRSLFLTVGAGDPRSRQIRYLVRTCIVAQRPLPSHWVLTWDKQALWDHFCKGIIPFMMAPRSRSHGLPEALGMRNTRECRGGADVGCVAFPVGA